MNLGIDLRFFGKDLRNIIRFQESIFSPWKCHLCNENNSFYSIIPIFYCTVFKRFIPDFEKCWKCKKRKNKFSFYWKTIDCANCHEKKSQLFHSALQVNELIQKNEKFKFCSYQCMGDFNSKNYVYSSLNKSKSFPWKQMLKESELYSRERAFLETFSELKNEIKRRRK